MSLLTRRWERSHGPRQADRYRRSTPSARRLTPSPLPLASLRAKQSRVDRDCFVASGFSQCTAFSAFRLARPANRGRKLPTSQRFELLPDFVAPHVAGRRNSRQTTMPATISAPTGSPLPLMRLRQAPFALVGSGRIASVTSAGVEPALTTVAEGRAQDPLAGEHRTADGSRTGTNRDSSTILRRIMSAIIHRRSSGRSPLKS
jgi:hypothetical protein